MIKLEKEDVRKLEYFEANEFADWFFSGMIDINEEDKRPFSPLHLYIGRHELIRDIKEVYDLLSGRSKINFSKGLTEAIYRMPKENKYCEIIEKLLFLVGAINDVRALPAIIAHVGNGFFGKCQKNAEKLYIISFNIICGMIPSPKVKEAVLRLIASSFFRYNYAPMAFIALCASSPKEFPDHLRLLRDHFTLLHKEEGYENVFMTAKRFTHYVDDHIIAKKLHSIYVTTDPAIDSEKTDAWLIDSLFFDANAQLCLINSISSFKIKNNNLEYDIYIPYNDNGLSFHRYMNS